MLKKVIVDIGVTIVKVNFEDVILTKIIIRTKRYFPQRTWTTRESPYDAIVIKVHEISKIVRTIGAVIQKLTILVQYAHGC